MDGMGWDGWGAGRKWRDLVTLGCWSFSLFGWSRRVFFSDSM